MCACSAQARTLAFVASVLLACTVYPAAARCSLWTRCPPKNFDSVVNFDINQYASAPWYVQKQVPVSYQPANELYCVRARYTLFNPSNPQDGIKVENTANRGAVNGPRVGAADANRSMDLVAVPDYRCTSGPRCASKLLVGPAQLWANGTGLIWRTAFGPYWVVAVGRSANKTLGYDWAIITGGAPRTPTSSGACRTGSALLPQDRQYFGGFWLFSRTPVDPEATAIMEQEATRLGLDTSDLIQVQHQGCQYPA